jgi:hypothetical protein
MQQWALAVGLSTAEGGGCIEDGGVGTGCIRSDDVFWVTSLLGDDYNGGGVTA